MCSWARSISQFAFTSLYFSRFLFFFIFFFYPCNYRVLICQTHVAPYKYRIGHCCLRGLGKPQTSLPGREERRNEKTGQAKEKDKQQDKRASGSALTLLAFSSTCISSLTCKISQNRIMHISYCRNPKRSTALYRSKLVSSHDSTSALSLPWKHK